VPKSYSLYEAKTKLSQLVRQVREGGPAITITLHGRPVAELRPVEAAPESKSAAERLEELERAGLLHTVPAPSGAEKFPLGVRRPGGLARFLEDRE
jgi:prevent-host-death family protein